MEASLILIFTTLCLASCQHQGLINYLEQRLAAIEGGITVWHELSDRYVEELREFKQQVNGLTENIKRDHEALRADFEDVGNRVDRLERELDYIETQNPALPCVDMDKDLLEHEIPTVKEENLAKHNELSV